MARIILFGLCCVVCLLLLQSVISLKCRVGNQQADDRFQRALQTCRRQYSSQNKEGEDSDYSSEDENNNESWNLDVFEKNLFINSGNKLLNTQSDKWNYGGNNQKNSNDQRYSYNYTNANSKNQYYNYPTMQYPNTQGNNNRFGNSDDDGMNYDRMNYDRMYGMNAESNKKEQEQACLVQCFFNELDAVDQRGFPEQQLVIQLLTRSIQNPELRDFTEETIIECFHYLNSDTKRDKCYFSQNLLYCMAEKGKERCDDWDNY